MTYCGYLCYYMSMNKKIEEAKKKIQDGLKIYYEQGKERFSKHFSESSFWDKIKTFAKKIGYDTVKQALTLYYCFTDSKTPTKAKAAIVAALGYFILPLDFIVDFIAPIGFLDDIAVLAFTWNYVKGSITDVHRKQAEEKMQKYFGDPPPKSKAKKDKKESSKASGTKKESPKKSAKK